MNELPTSTNSAFVEPAWHPISVTVTLVVDEFEEPGAFSSQDEIRPMRCLVHPDGFRLDVEHEEGAIYTKVPSTIIECEVRPSAINCIRMSARRDEDLGSGQKFRFFLESRCLAEIRRRMRTDKAKDGTGYLIEVRGQAFGSYQVNGDLVKGDVFDLAVMFNGEPVSLEAESIGVTEGPMRK